MPIDLRQQAQSLIGAKKFAEARAVLVKICEQSPEDTAAWNQRAALHAALGEYAECEACCRVVAERQPGTSGAWYNLGNALSFQKKFDEAEPVYRRAIRISPTFADAHNNLGNVLREKKLFDQAERCYRDALSHRPDYPGALANLGVVLYEMHRFHEAHEFFERALRVSPDNVTALLGFGKLLVESGQPGRGQELLERVVTISPGNIQAWVVLGSLYAQTRQHDKGIAACRRVMTLQPDNADARVNLGFIHQASGRVDEAEKMYREALSLNPDMDRARYFLAAIGRESAPDRAPAEYVKTLFDEYAGRFDSHLVETLEYRTPELLEAAVRRALPGNTAAALDVLDLGCGTGLGGMRYRDLARRLIGVDLSPGMIAKARERGVYDELVVGDVTEMLRDREAAFDLVVAADVFVYIGDLDGIVRATSQALRANGLFAFSTETDDMAHRFTLRPTGRYAHAPAYVAGLARTEGFEMLVTEGVIVRKDAGGPIHGHIHVLRKA